MNLAALLALAPRVADVLTLGGRNEAARTVLQLADAVEQLHEALAEARSVNTAAMTLLEEAATRTETARRERDAAWAAAREWMVAEDALTAAIVAAEGHGTDDGYAEAVVRRNAADVALRALLAGGAR